MKIVNAPVFAQPSDEELRRLEAKRAELEAILTPEALARLDAVDRQAIEGDRQ